MPFSTKRRIQWGYLLVSTAILVALLPVMRERYAAQALSAVFVTALCGYVIWLAPVSWRRAYFRKASGMVKLASTFNFLALIIVMQMAIERWWGGAVNLAMLFGIILAAGLVFHMFVVPIANATYLLLIGPLASSKDPREQGRTVYRDES